MVILKVQPCYTIIVCQNYNHNVSWYWPWDFRCDLQGLSRNALADPGILGLHSGASFGLIIFVTFFHSINENASILIPLFTFGGEY